MQSLIHCSGDWMMNQISQITIGYALIKHNIHESLIRHLISLSHSKKISDILKLLCYYPSNNQNKIRSMHSKIISLSNILWFFYLRRETKELFTAWCGSFLLDQLQRLTVCKTGNETCLPLPQGAVNPLKWAEFVWVSEESFRYYTTAEMMCEEGLHFQATCRIWILFKHQIWSSFSDSDEEQSDCVWQFLPWGDVIEENMAHNVSSSLLVPVKVGGLMIHSLQREHMKCLFNTHIQTEIGPQPPWGLTSLPLLQTVCLCVSLNNLTMTIPPLLLCLITPSAPFLFCPEEGKEIGRISGSTSGGGERRGSGWNEGCRLGMAKVTRRERRQRTE